MRPLSFATTAMIAAAAALALVSNLFLPQALAARPELQIADNVFVVPDVRAKVITGWLVVKAGYADEGRSCTGIAHYLEHLLLINRNADGTSKVDALAEGRGNGWTSQSATIYFQTTPSADSQSLDRLVAYLASLLTSVNADEQQSERERNVVLQEYQLRYARVARTRFASTLRKALMPGDILGKCDIGTPETISGFTLEQAKWFHSQWYARNNAVLIFHGPVDREALLESVRKRFLSLPTRTLPKRSRSESHRYQPDSVTVRERDRNAYQTIVYVQKLLHYAEPYDRSLSQRLNSARNFIAAFLRTELPASPAAALQRTGLVSSLGMSVEKVRAGTLKVSFWGIPAQGKTPEAVAAAARTYIDNLALLEFSESLLDRLRQRTLLQRQLRQQEPLKQAQDLQQWFAGGGSYPSWLELEDVMADTTTEHVRVVLRAMSGPGRVLVGILEPSADSNLGNTAKPGAPIISERRDLE